MAALAGLATRSSEASHCWARTDGTRFRFSVLRCSRTLIQDASNRSGRSNSGHSSTLTMLHSAWALKTSRVH